MKKAISLLAMLGLAAPVFADLVDARQDTTPGGAVVDGILSPGEYGNGAYSYTGAGSGFGGTLGGGTLYFDSDATNLYVGFMPGNNINDNVLIMLDTRDGGFLDADMDDQADGGRRVSSNQAAAANDAYPEGMLPDFSIVIGNFGIVSFELTAGNTPGHLNFLNYSGQFTGGDPTFREYSLPLASLGINRVVEPEDCIKFFAAYISDGGYASNESIPAYQPLQDNGNPGFGDGQFGGTIGTPGYGNYNKFCYIPEPASLLALGLLGGLIRRR